MSLIRVATLGLLILAAVLLQPGPLAAAQVPVRFAEGVTHGFLQLCEGEWGRVYIIHYERTSQGPPGLSPEKVQYFQLSP